MWKTPTEGRLNVLHSTKKLLAQRAYNVCVVLMDTDRPWLLSLPKHRTTRMVYVRATRVWKASCCRSSRTSALPEHTTDACKRLVYDAYLLERHRTEPAAYAKHFRKSFCSRAAKGAQPSTRFSANFIEDSMPRREQYPPPPPPSPRRAAQERPRHHAQDKFLSGDLDACAADLGHVPEVPGRLEIQPRTRPSFSGKRFRPPSRRRTAGELGRRQQG
jgi:hypothetical protein